MPTNSKCPSCGIKMKLPDDATGKRFKCPKCQNIFTAGNSTQQNRNTSLQPVEEKVKLKENTPVFFISGDLSLDGSVVGLKKSTIHIKDGFFEITSSKFKGTGGKQIINISSIEQFGYKIGWALAKIRFLTKEHGYYFANCDKKITQQFVDYLFQKYPQLKEKNIEISTIPKKPIEILHYKPKPKTKDVVIGIVVILVIIGIIALLFKSDGIKEKDFAKYEELLNHTERLIPCSKCNGSGMCSVCKGKGCNSCNQSGFCVECKGSGCIASGADERGVFRKYLFEQYGESEVFHWENDWLRKHKH